MKLGLSEGGEDGEYNGTGFIGISKTFSMQDASLFRIGQFNSIYLYRHHGRPHTSTHSTIIIETNISIEHGLVHIACA